MTYQYSKDWFTGWAPEVWLQLVDKLPMRKRFLEIGSYEGRSAVWTVENMMEDGGEIVCIDTWAGGEEHATMDGVEDRFDYNIATLRTQYPDRYVTKMKSPSLGALIVANEQYDPFDFVYIDGSHVAKDVLTDAVLAWPCLRPGGIICFDDYLYGDPRDILHRPKIAVDAFVNIFSEQLEFIHVGYQMIVRKKP